MQYIILLGSLGLLMILAYRGYSTILTAPILALLTLFLYDLVTPGAHISIMAAYTEQYMAGFANFVRNYFPLFLTGAIFAKLMDASGYGRSIASAISKVFGKKQSIFAVVLSGAVLTYGGVSLFVVAFVLYPIADSLFRDADIPKRLIPGSIALGAFTFTMTALPGSPSVQNVIPISYFGTDTFAAPITGLAASLLMLILGLSWLMWRSHRAQKKGEVYHFDANHMTSEPTAAPVKEASPSIFKAILPILLIFLINLYFTKWYYPNYDAALLEPYGISINKAAGTWSVILALVIASLVLLLLERGNWGSIRQLLEDGVRSSFLPLLNSSAIVGYGTAIQSIGIFQSIQRFIFQISSNPLISEALSVNIICGLTASASGGLGMTLDAISAPLLQAAASYQISPELLHRIAALCSGGLDTLPHNGAVITTLAICGLTHKDSYLDIFITSVVIPILVSFLIVFILI